MAATLSRIVFDQAGNVRMVVHPDWDAQLADPAFAPQGSVWVDVPRADYQGCASRRDLLVLAKPVITAKSVAAGLAILTRIQAIDDAFAPDAVLDASS